MRISIVIPVYNSHEYLRECVGSITRQTFRDIEVLLVDDGSTDDSGALCDELAAHDPRVIAIHKKNGGTSSARNEGVARATGDYLTFCDNDDFLRDDGCLARVAACLSDRLVDVLMHDNCMYDDPTGTIVPPRETHLAGEVASLGKGEAMLSIISHGVVSRAVWNKVVRTSLVRDAGIAFPEGMRNEDTDWSASVFEHAQSVGWLDDPYYCYRKGHGYAQTSKPVTRAMTDDLARIVGKHIATIDELGLAGVEARAIRAYLAYPFIVWMGQTSSIGECRRDDKVSLEMCAHAPSLLAAHEDPSVARAALAYRILGFWGTARLLGIAFRLSQEVARGHQS
ncbi:glycosyltransferase [Olsenella sp. Marseille-P4559]|uniref:glycosyltransferase family 2 protein n=1 Tax=Olsenella sp. Marseille-P4559 TaxID=2364795 RepID=UPI001031D123|nr:glycosyltransferase [Olsenella sp. Marseille-P4559]